MAGAARRRRRHAPYRSLLIFRCLTGKKAGKEYGRELISAMEFYVNEEKGLLKRLVAELNRDVPNLKASVERVSIEEIEMAGIVQSSFADFSSLLSSSPETFQKHSAFYIYHTDATFFSIRALREALCSYYGAAGSILRNAYEAIVRGDFWECLAREIYRDHP